MHRSLRLSLAALAGITIATPVRRELGANLALARRRWSEAPATTARDIGLSSIGQLLFWTVGQDFIGIGMDRKWGPGLGHRFAAVVQRQLPVTPRVAWTLKVIEIASDATKMPIEGRLYRELGYVPDIVAAAVTQPAWSLIEVTEKLIGIANHPERVTTAEQISDSISSIYGTWTRNLLSYVLFRYGDRFRDRLLAHF